MVVPPCTVASSSPSSLCPVMLAWRGRGSALLSSRMYLHCRPTRCALSCTVAPAQGARLPCTGALRACAARRAGSGGVVGWASSGATRGRVGSGGTRGARSVIICHVTRDQSLYHMSGYAWQRNSPCQLTWADGPGYFQAKKEARLSRAGPGLPASTTYLLALRQAGPTFSPP